MKKHINLAANVIHYNSLRFYTTLYETVTLLVQELPHRPYKLSG